MIIPHLFWWLSYSFCKQVNPLYFSGLENKQHRTRFCDFFIPQPLSLESFSQGSRTSSALKTDVVGSWYVETWSFSVSWLCRNSIHILYFDHIPGPPITCRSYPPYYQCNLMFFLSLYKTNKPKDKTNKNKWTQDTKPTKNVEININKQLTNETEKGEIKCKGRECL